MGDSLMKKSIIDHPPGKMLRASLRLPIWLYRLRLGWLLGSRFLLLHHTGRKSRKMHETVIEVVRHDRKAKIYYAVSGWGNRADWYQNVRADPDVLIQVGKGKFQARAVFLPLNESIRILDAYAREHPFAFRELTSLFLGQRLQAVPASAQSLAEKMPMVAFCIRQKGDP
ncbi:MAG TPA: nitroreductase family deazaflavin-dependent oxidoreductase [Anaerolineales bacterium]|nr:nitroreductase family deazaflavin-dependent oxidoreductase [Anaerolineales bacterium]